MKKNKNWFSKPWWLIGIFLLVICTLINSQIADRLSIILFFSTAILFVFWYLKLRDKITFKYVVYGILLLTVIFVSLFLILSWIKCGNRNSCNIFDGYKYYEYKDHKSFSF